jgi:predicted nucleotidyltransferase
MKLLYIVNQINTILLENFDDYKGAYLFGSQLTGKANEDSDIDIVLIFDELNLLKKLEIAGLISTIEYKYNIFIDCKLLTTNGTKSIEYIRKNINPYFIEEAIDKGIFYAK